MGISIPSRTPALKFVSDFYLLYEIWAHIIWAYILPERSKWSRIEIFLTNILQKSQVFDRKVNFA